jgi:peptidoglycan/xylan/chitin deacetylase (PgdA/CDA1 family)
MGNKLSPGLAVSAGPRVVQDVQFATLTYHAIGSGNGSYTVSRQQLREQLARLRREGYVVEGFEQLEDRLRSGRALPRRYTVITLDDGYESAMWAAGILAEQGCLATLFLTRDWCMHRRGFLGPAEIREIRDAGFSFGTHGTTHRKLTFLSEEACFGELAGSKLWLENVIGEEVRYMAAPGGFINARILQLARDLGYVLVGTCQEWMNSPEAVREVGSVNRVNIRSHFSLRDFERIVGGDLGFYLWRRARSAALALPKQILYRWASA